ncbi:MAG TPA: hypothetical protein VIF35_20470 [Streptosporangiaceae bacterium]
MENQSEFWADVTAVVVTPVAIAAGLAKGTYDASTDKGAFIEGFNGTANPIIRAGKNFGAEHGPTITKGVVTGAAGALGARIVHVGLRAFRL